MSAFLNNAGSFTKACSDVVSLYKRVIVDYHDPDDSSSDDDDDYVADSIPMADPSDEDAAETKEETKEAAATEEKPVEETAETADAKEETEEDECPHLFNSEQMASIILSVNSFHELINVIKGNGKTGAKLRVIFEKLAKSLKEVLDEPIVIVVSDSEKVQDSWLRTSESDKRNEDGYRKIVIYPSDKDRSINIPLSEIYDMSIELYKKSPDDYSALPARILYTFLTTISSSVNEEDTDTTEIEMSCARLARTAKVNAGKDFIDFESISSKMFGQDGMSEGVTDMIKGGTLEKIIKTATDKMGGMFGEDTLKDGMGGLQEMVQKAQTGDFTGAVETGKELFNKVNEKVAEANDIRDTNPEDQE